MDRHVFILALFGAAALLAMWTYVRIGERGPTALSRIIVHALIAMFVLRIATFTVTRAVGGGEFLQTAGVLLGVLLPALVYVFLTSLWVLRTIQSALAR